MITTKTFRIFISSTFSDMAHERRHLQKEIFPKLREFCKRNGAKFQAVDLRWGVNEETQLDQKTMQLCLKEIHRCQQISPKPNFIVLVGNRYGWQPIPDIIPGKEMKAIFSVLHTNEKGMIDQWYREDTNAIPTEFVLQPKGDAYKEYPVWEKVESKLRSNLRSAVNKLNFTKEQRIKFFTSATHQEIIRGALLPENAQEHVFAYLRTIEHLPDNNDADGYTDLTEGEKDGYATEMIRDLKKELLGKLEESHIHNYSAEWVPDKKDINITELEAFGNRVYEDLKQIIEGDLQEINSQSESGKELEAHKTFKEYLLNGFVGREDTIESILHYLAGREQEPFFCLIGPSGAGKSSVMAKAIAEAEKIPGTTIIYRFIGATPSSSEILSLYMGISEQIAGLLGLNITELREQIRTEQNVTEETRLQKKVFQHLIEKAGEGNISLQLFIDALDQVKNIDNIQIQDWFADQLPENIRIVISILEQYKEKVNNGLIHELPLMPSDIAEKILKGWFSGIEPKSRTLTEKQFNSIIKGFSKIGLPLFLKICFELTKEWRSFEDNSISAESINDLLFGYFQTLEKNHDAEIVKTAIGYMLSGKDGLTEDEILDLFVFDNQKQQNAYHYAGPSFWEYYLDKRVFKTHREEIEQMGSFPVIVWSRLLFDLLPFLSERDIPGGRAFVFFHRIMAEYARNRYYNPFRDRWHNNLADYFEDDVKSPLFIDLPRLQPNIRRVIEQPYQETVGGQWGDLYDKTLGNYEFVEAKIKANMLNDILEDYAFAERSDTDRNLKEPFSIWQSFMKSNMHILRRGSAEWPSYKIFLQLAAEHADDSPLTIRAEKYLTEGKVDWAWLRREQRVKTLGNNPCIAVLEGHSNYIDGVIELVDGRILSWSGDLKLGLWDKGGRFISFLVGHSDCIYGAIELIDKRILSWSKDRTLRLWDKNGRALTTLNGHTHFILGAIELKNGNVLSWSRDKSLRLWNCDGEILNSLNGHTNAVNGAIELTDGRLLSWSWDSTLYIWNKDGIPCSLLKGHNGDINGAIELADGRILSWSHDKTLCIWDINGNLLLTLKGHTDSVNYAIELKHGQILSISKDTTLRLWDISGRPLTILQGHSDSLNWLDAIELKDGRILSWGDDTPRIWDKNGTLLKLLEGHSHPVYGVRELYDGQFLSWSYDRTLRIWDNSGNLLTILRGHSDSVKNALEIQDGKIISWSNDGTIRIWDRGRNEYSVLEGHTFSVDGAFELINRRVVTWSNTSGLLLWDKDGNLLKKMGGQFDDIFGVIELHDQRILSWTFRNNINIWNHDGNQLSIPNEKFGWSRCAFHLKDGRILSWGGSTLRIWDRDVNPIYVLKGHTSPVWGAIELHDGRLLSWSMDTTLIIWDINGNSLGILTGHSHWVLGAIELHDDHLLTWSQDKTMRLWNKDGKPLQIFDGYFDFANGGVIELNDRRLLAWNCYRNLQIWENEKSPKILSWDEGIAKFIEFKSIFPNYNNFHENYLNFFYQLFFSKEHLVKEFCWHGQSVCTTRYIKQDGLHLLSQANGQVCFLKTYIGNKKVTLDELETYMLENHN